MRSGRRATDAVLRRPAARLRSSMTDAGPAGPAPLGTSDGEKELEAYSSCVRPSDRKKSCGSSNKEFGDYGNRSSMSKGQEDEEPALPSIRDGTG